MNKERAAQIAEKDAIKYEQMVIVFLSTMFSVFLGSLKYNFLKIVTYYKEFTVLDFSYLLLFRSLKYKKSYYLILSLV